MQEEEYTIPQLVDDIRAGKMPRRRFIKALAAMGISAVGIGAITAAATRSFASNAPSHPALKNSLENDPLKLHDQHLANQTQGNTGGLQNDYASNAIVEDSMHPHAFIGHEAIMARKNVGLAAIPNLHINVTNRVVHGNQLTVEWVASGTHAGDFSGLPASGRSFSIPGVTVVVRNNGKIVRESIYYDIAEVHRQLGPQ